MRTSNKQENRKNKNGGFTLIEVLIAVVIFSSSLAGLLLMVGTGIGNVNVSKNKLVASYLAQEGIEIVRYKRDYSTQTNQTGGWAAFASLMNNCGTVDSCGVSALGPTDAPVFCGNGNTTNCRVVQDSAGSTPTGAYDMFGNTSNPSAQGWAPTIFSRFVYLEAPTNTTDVYVIHSTVKWLQGTGTYTTSMSETIYNWH